MRLFFRGKPKPEPKPEPIPTTVLVLRLIQTLSQKVDNMALRLDALEAAINKLVTDFPVAVADAVAKQEAVDQAKVDALTQQLTDFDNQILPPVA